jgi:hypothetical protein
MLGYNPRLVSTIIAVHKRARMLAEAVSSMLGQIYRPMLM